MRTLYKRGSVITYFLITAVFLQPFLVFAQTTAENSPSQSGETAATDTNLNAQNPEVSQNPASENSNNNPDSPSTEANASTKSPSSTATSKADPKSKPGGDAPPPEVSLLETDTPPSFTLDKESRIKSEPNKLTGAMEMTYELSIPPGRNKLQPSAKLVYSSDDLNNVSPFGYGWSFDIPYIERMNKGGENHFHNLTYFYSSLDGELASTTSNNYRAKIENGSFNKYEFATSTSGWTVTDKFGTVYTFGVNASARQDKIGNSNKVNRWMLEEVRDVNDNYISYTYFKDYGQIYLATTTYTGNGANAGIFKLEFFHEPRTDVGTTSVTGFFSSTRFRINEIQAQINGSWVRKYALAYATGDNGVRTLLTSITETGKDESGTTITLPATTFNYRDYSAPSWPKDTSYAFPQALSGGGFRILDVDGDALVDLFKYIPGTQNNGVYINNGEGSWDFKSTYTNFPNGIDTTEPWKYRYIDLNGDRLVDIYRMSNDGSPDNGGYINNGSSGWVKDAAYSDFPSGLFTDDYFGLDDLNNDGMADIIKGTAVYLNNGKTGWTYDPNYTAPLSMVDGIRAEDINGDGLGDQIRMRSGYQDEVDLNNSATGFTMGYDFNLANVFFTDDAVRLMDVNGDGLVDIVKRNKTNTTGNGVYINKGTNAGWVSGTDNIPFDFTSSAMIADINADGLVDLATTTAVYINNARRADLLTRITNSFGGKTDITYKPSPLYRNPENLNPRLPFILYTVNKLDTTDGLGATTTSMTYEYGGGINYFNNFLDRKFAGFATTTVTNAAGFITKTFFHQGNTTDSSNGEYSDHISKSGKPYKIETYDNAGNLYSAVINKWENYDLGQKRNFVKLTQKVDILWDTDTSDNVAKAEQNTYSDLNGNLTQKIEWGKVTVSSANGTFTDTGTDKFTTAITYAASTTPYILGFPSVETVTDQNSSKVKETKYYYDSLTNGNVDYGNETKREFWKTGVTYVDTEKTFNAYGLVTQEKDPRDKATNFTYDSNNLYIATSTNPLSQATGYAYDYSNGKVKRKADSNGFVFETVFDALDRIKEIKQPDLTTPSTRVTKTVYAYTDTQPRSVQETQYLDGTTSFDIYRYYDGLGRIVQERKEAEDVSTYAIKDYAYNNKGLLQKESLPYFSSGSSKTTATSTTALFATYIQDPFERVKSVANAVGTTTYTFDDWATRITDPEGNIKDLSRDAYNNLIQVIEHNATTTYTSAYEYNYLGNLTKITDAKSNVRNFTYDGLGRRTASEDLHASGDSYYGSWSFTLDDAGNITSYTDPESHTVNYTYDDINRPLTEDFTGIIGTEVTFAYDSCQYGIGHLCAATTTSSGTGYLYNAMGVKSQEAKVIGGTKYITKFDYDRQGNQTKVTYPDNAEANYTYNTAGLLESVSRKESGGSVVSVITDYDYAPTEQATLIAFNNGAETVRTYDRTKLYRLQYLITSFPGGVGGLMFGGGGETLSLELQTGQNIISDNIQTDTPISNEPVSEPVSENATENSDIDTEATQLNENASQNQASTEEPADRMSDDSNSNPVSNESGSEIQIQAQNENGQNNSAETLIEVSQNAQAIPTDPTVSESSQSTEVLTETVASESNDTNAQPVGITSELPPAATTNATSELPQAADVAVTPDLPEQAASQAVDALALKAKSEKILAHQTVDDIRCENKVDEVTGDPETCINVGQKVEYYYISDTAVEPEDHKGMKENVAKRTSNTRFYSDSLGHEILKVYTGYPFYLDNASNAWKHIEFATTTPKVWAEQGGDSFGGISTMSLTFFDGAGDGHIRYKNGGSGSWSGMHDALTGTAAYPTDASGEIDVLLYAFNGGFNQIRRAFFPFDTSSLAVSDSITSATLNVYATAVDDQLTDNNNDWFNVVQTSQPSSTTLTTADYDLNGSAITNPTEGGTRIDASALSVNAYNSWSLNATGIGWIKRSGQTSNCGTTAGYTCLGVREGHDALNNHPVDPRDNLADRTGITYSNSETAGTTQDPYLEIVLATPATVIQDLTYTYDNVGNITRIVDVSDTDTEKTMDYTYDDLSRLTVASSTLAAATQTNFKETYTYNPLGNLTYKSDVGQYAYEGNSGTNYANPHAATSINGTAQTYGRNGNQLSNGTWNYRWNYKNQLTKATSTNAISNFSYDHEGLRVLLKEGNATTTFANRLYSVETATTTKHIYANGVLIATVEKKNGTTTPNVNYVHTDHLSGSNAITNDQDELTQLLDYFPYGKPRINSHLGTFNERRKFIGEEYDEGTQLSYLQARYYSGSRGLFLSQDPVFWESKQNLQNPQSLNSYSYAENNPIVKKDPGGREPFTISAALTSPVWGPLIVSSAAALLYTSYNAFAYQNRWGTVFSGPREIPNVGWPQKPGDFEPHGNGPWGKIGGIIGGGLLAAYEYIFEPWKEKKEFSEDWKEKTKKQPNASSGGIYIGPSSISTPSIYGQAYKNYLNSGNYGSLSTQSRYQAAQSYNASISSGFSSFSSHGGGSSLAGTHWVLSNGTVVTWEGQVISGPTSK